MNKLLSSLFVLLLFFNFFSANVLATDMVYKPYPYDTNTFGTNQFYNVVFDGEGQAAVVAKILVQNLGKDTINELLLELPGKNVRIISILQEVNEKEQRCSYYNYNCITYAKDPQCTQYNNQGECVKTERICIKQDQQCASWYNQTIWPPKYYNLDKTEEQLSESKRIKLKLDVSIKEQETGTFILYYKTDGLANEKLGVFDFDFQTIKMNFDTQQVRVSISVNPELYFQGGEANVNYQPSFAVFDKAELMSAKGVQSQELSDFSRNIQYSSGYTKTAQGLDPWESFSVKGKYATSWLMLNKAKIFSGIIIVLAIITGIIFGIRKALRIKKTNVSLAVGLTSFVSSILLTCVWFGGIKLLQWFSNLIYYNSGASMIILLLGLLWIVLMITALFAPSIYLGIKYGIIPAIINFAATLIILLIINIALIILFGTLTNTGRFFY